MKSLLYKQNFKKMLKDITVCKITTPVLGVALVVAMFGWLSKDTVVVVNPPENHKAYKIARDNASHSYKESWATALAILIGNASPKQANFIIDQVRTMVAPSAYRSVSDSLIEHFANLQKNGLVTTFTPKEFTKAKGAIYVTGKLNLIGSGTKPKQMDYTFKVRVQIKNYMPSIIELDFFEGSPKVVR